MKSSNPLFLASTLFLLSISLATFSQDTNTKKLKATDPEKENSDPRSRGLQRLTHQLDEGHCGHLNYPDVNINIDVDAIVNNALKSVDVALASLEIAMDEIDVKLDAIDIDLEPLEIEPMDIDIDWDGLDHALDLNLDQHDDFDTNDDWENEKDQEKIKEKDEDKVKDKEKEKEKEKNKEKEKTKGLVKIKKGE